MAPRGARAAAGEPMSGCGTFRTSGDWVLTSAAEGKADIAEYCCWTVVFLRNPAGHLRRLKARPGVTTTLSRARLIGFLASCNLLSCSQRSRAAASSKNCDRLMAYFRHTLFDR